MYIHTVRQNAHILERNINKRKILVVQVWSYTSTIPATLKAKARKSKLEACKIYTSSKASLGNSKDLTDIVQ